MKHMTPVEKLEYVEREAIRKKLSSPRLRCVVSFVLAFTLLISGSMAYFSDRAHVVEQATAGTVQVTLDDSGVNLLNAEGLDILNPGDVRDFNLTVVNEGNKSVDAKMVITLTSSVPMSDNNGDNISYSLRSFPTVPTDDAAFNWQVYANEYELYWANDIVYVDGAGHYPKDGALPLSGAVRAMNSSKTQIVYTLPIGVLSGNESHGEYEAEYCIPSMMNQLGTELRDLINDRTYEVYWDVVTNKTEFGYNADDYILEIGMYDELEDYLLIAKTWPILNGNEDEYVEIDYIEIDLIYHSCIPTGLVVPSSLKGVTVRHKDIDGETVLVDRYSLEEFKNTYGTNIITYDDVSEINALCENKYYTNIEYQQLTDAEKAECILVSSSQTYDMVLLFDAQSGNEFQNSNVSIEVEVFAKQHRNTNDDAWVLTDSKLNAIIQDSIFTVNYDDLHRVKITGLKDGVDWDSLTEITIPEGVEVIPYGFFYNCTNIEKVNLPNTITAIEGYAFLNCTSLAEINLPEGLETIDYCAFSGCTNLKSITIPGSVTYMGETVFEDSGLESVVVSEGITELGYGVFQNATNLSSVELPSTLKKIGNECFTDCSSLTSIEIPYGVTYIDCAFVRTGLTSIIIPNSVTYLSGYTFYGCADLTTVTLSNQLTKLESGLFQECTSLTSVTIDGYAPNVIDGNITKIDSVVFENTKITEIVIGNSVTYIENNAFRYCDNLTTITIGDNVHYIGYTAFRCSSTVVTTVYTNNQEAIDFNWSRYYRQVTILPIS